MLDLHLSGLPVRKGAHTDGAPLGLGRCSDDDSWCFEHLMTCIYHVVSFNFQKKNPS